MSQCTSTLYIGIQCTLLNQTSLQSNSDVRWLDWNSLEMKLVSVYIEIPTYTSKDRILSLCGYSSLHYFTIFTLEYCSHWNVPM